MILFDATPLQSEHRLRGLGKYTLNLALELVQMQPDTIRFATATRGINLLPNEIRKRAIVARRGHRPAQVYWLYNEWFFRKIARQAQPSLIHATDFNGLVTPGGIPLVATLHDLTVLKEGLRHRDLSGRLSDLRWWIYFNHKLPKASHIIAISKSVKLDAMNLLGISENKITVIPHGINTGFFRPDHRFKRTDNPYLLFVGSRNENKNLCRVLKAFSVLQNEFPKMQLLIAGAWSQLDITWLEQQTIQFQVNERVQYLGFVPDDELPSLYSNSEAFLFPSIEEGFGLPILEAMACGTPVITSNRGAMQEVAGPAALLVEPMNTDSLIAGIRELISKPTLKARLTKLGQERAKEFSWKSAATRTIAVYQNARLNKGEGV